MPSGRMCIASTAARFNGAKVLHWSDSLEEVVDDRILAGRCEVKKTFLNAVSV